MQKYVVMKLKKNKNNLKKGFFIYPLGGHQEWGRNCTAIRVDNSFVVLDMGIKFCDGPITAKIPPMRKIKKLMLKYNWVGTIISHAHADHFGAISECKKYFGSKFPMVYGSPVTCNIINKLQKIPLSKLQPVRANKQVVIGDIKFSLWPMQHSVPETRAIIIESEYGKFGYMTDFKVDYTPVLGAPSCFKGLKNSDILMVDVTRVSDKITHSEGVAVAKLKDILKRGQLHYKKLICSTYPSQWARLLTIAQFAHNNNMGYWVVGKTYKIMYRLMFQMDDPATGKPYISEKLYKHIKFINLVELSQLSDRSEIFLMSGHQRMQQSALIKIFRQRVKFKIRAEDMIIFASTEIRDIYRQPTSSKLKYLRAKSKIGFVGISGQHVSGHAGVLGHEIAIKSTMPRHIIPTHTSIENYGAYAEIAKKFNYNYGKNLTFMVDAQYYQYDAKKNNFTAHNW